MRLNGVSFHASQVYKPSTRRIRARHVVAAVAAMSIGLVGCSSGGGTGGQGADGTVVIAQQQDVSTLDPTKQYAANATGLFSNIFDSLTAISAEGELEGILASDWTATEESKVWDFTLRPDLVFSNGEELTADDVVFTFQTLKDDPTSPYAAAIATLDSVEKIDDVTVRFVHSTPRSDWGRILNVFFIIPDETYAEDPEGFASAPVGSGPYQVDSWSRDSVMELSANPEYWGDEVDVEWATLRTVPSLTAAVSALQAGDVDLVPIVPPEEVQSLEQQDGIELATADTNRVAYLAMNMDDGALGDNNLRRAIDLAVDREAMVKLLSGQAVPNSQPVTPATFGFDSELPVQTRDLEEAKRLLADSSYDGEAITFTYPTDRTPWMTNLAQLIAAQLEEAGIKTEMTPVKYSAFLPNWFDAKKSLPGIYLHTYGPSGMDAATPIQEFLVNPGRTSYDNPAVSALAAEQLAVEDEAARAEIISELWQEASKDSPYAWLFTEKQTGAVSTDYEWTPRADTQIRVKEIKRAS